MEVFDREKKYVHHNFWVTGVNGLPQMVYVPILLNVLGLGVVWYINNSNMGQTNSYGLYPNMNNHPHHSCHCWQ